MRNICIIKDCDGIVVSYGLCDKHRKYLHRTGNIIGSGLVERKCEQCGNIFNAKTHRKKYCNMKCYSLSPSGKEKHRSARRAYAKRNKGASRVKARKAAGRHPFKKEDSCLVCDTKEKLHRHHHNYKKSKDVTFLCKRHHHELHSWDSN